MPWMVTVAPGRKRMMSRDSTLVSHAESKRDKCRRPAIFGTSGQTAVKIFPDCMRPSLVRIRKMDARELLRCRS